MNNFKDLIVWQKAVALVISIYEILRCYPDSERYNLVSQMHRAAVSIPSTIAEGCGRNSKAVFKNFLEIALGSSYELETQILISRKLKFIKEADYEALANKVSEIQKMLYKLISTL